MMRFSQVTNLILVLVGLLPSAQMTWVADWPMLGRDGTRNSVSSEAGAPRLWSVEEREGGRLVRAARGIHWTAALGSATFSSPVVTGGFVWIGTNNGQPGV